MTEALEWLLGLERIRLGESAPLTIRFASAPAPWIMLFGAVIAAFLVFRFYRREAVKGGWRWPLMLLRFGVIMLVLFLLGRPMLVLRRNHIEPSIVPVLLDRSASMVETDVPIAERERSDGGEPAQSRWSAAVQALSAPEHGLLQRILTNHRAELWTFGKTADRLGTIETSDNAHWLSDELNRIKPEDSRTDIVGGLRAALGQTRVNRVAGVVLLSDGRQTSPLALQAALRRTDARSVPIHVIAAGSTTPRRDIGLISAWSEEDVFVNDTVNIQVRLEVKGFASTTPMTLELRDKITGEVIENQTAMIEGGQVMWRGELQYRPETVGRRVLRIAAVPHPEEKDLENNWADIVVRAHDEKIGVLYVESVPRYEYRYLKNLLLREPTLDSSCLLLDATAGFTQEGTRPIQRFPRSVEELGHYDVVILGDVDPRSDWLSPVQESMLVDFVSLQGGGLAFVAGERNMPHSLQRTKLEKILPVKIAPQFFGRYETALVNAFVPKLTPEGREHPIFRFEFDRVKNDTLLASSPGWYWFANVLGPQPAATVLAVHPSVQADRGPLPVAVLGRFGAGRTFFLGSDDLWRWRQYDGESHYENTWLQVIRTLARGRKLGMRQPWHLDTDGKTYELGQRVRIELINNRKHDLRTIGEKTVLVRDELDALVGRVALTRDEVTKNTWRGEFVPRRIGIFSLSINVPIGQEHISSPVRTISVTSRDIERAELESDHDFLKRLAVRSGGSFRQVTDDLGELAAIIPDRSVQIPDDLEEPIWDTRLILVLFIGLIVTEWIIRKTVGLA